MTARIAVPKFASSATVAFLRRNRTMQTVLRLPLVKARTGLSRSTLYFRVAAGTFPAPIKLGAGARAVGWVETEIEQWLSQQISQSRLLTSE